MKYYSFTRSTKIDFPISAKLQKDFSLKSSKEPPKIYKLPPFTLCLSSLQSDSWVLKNKSIGIKAKSATGIVVCRTLEILATWILLCRPCLWLKNSELWFINSLKMGSYLPNISRHMPCKIFLNSSPKNSCNSSRLFDLNTLELSSLLPSILRLISKMQLSLAVSTYNNLIKNWDLQ